MSIVRRLCVVVSLVVAGGVAAHPGDGGHSHEKPANLRTWTIAGESDPLEASFVTARDSIVLLLKADGTHAWFPLDQLSPADQSWIENRRHQIQAINLWPATGAPIRLTTRPPTPASVGLGGIVLLTAVGLAGVACFARRRRNALPAMLCLGLPLCFVLACGNRPHDDAEEAAATEADDAGPAPAIVAHFQAFKAKLRFRWNADTLFIDSNGLPDHPMMVGITNWQQQVPLPQPYGGNNAWRIPLKPKLAERPISAKNALYRGAIALAVNGVPIFNALNNRGEDAFLIGELDEFGGHCGKADDYHYHAAPLHLQKAVGEGNPIGYALDGFPLFGLTDQKLDEFNGRFDEAGAYRYHSTKTYPYINGGLKGVVQVRNDGVEPQPRAKPARPAQSPLRGAKITGFKVDDAQESFSLTYQVKGQERKINYVVNANDTVSFVFVDDQGNERSETFRRDDRKGGKKDDGKKKKGKGPKKDE